MLSIGTQSTFFLSLLDMRRAFQLEHAKSDENCVLVVCS